jgi:hypothetical protein
MRWPVFCGFCLVLFIIASVQSQPGSYWAAVAVWSQLVTHSGRSCFKVSGQNYSQSTVRATHRRLHRHCCQTSLLRLSLPLLYSQQARSVGLLFRCHNCPANCCPVAAAVHQTRAHLVDLFGSQPQLWLCCLRKLPIISFSITVFHSAAAAASSASRRHLHSARGAVWFSSDISLSLCSIWLSLSAATAQSL